MRRMLPVVMAFSWLVPERKVRRSLAMFLALLLAAAVQAANTWHVDAKLGKDTGSGSTRGDAKQSIQAAIDAAAEGDTILVDDGIYSPIQTADKDIAIRSVNGAQTTIIDGGKAERCATLGGPGSAQNTVLDGFTLRNGYAAEGEGGGAYGGTLINCILVDNAAPLGDDGVASHGGGAYKCTLTNCTLTRNQADLGGGAHSCTLTNCILTGNQATEYGGGVYNGYALINCILSENMAEEGGGAYWCGLRNCTVTGNSAAKGGGVVGCSLENSIVWDNFAPEGPNYPEPGDDDSWFDYSCTEPLPEDGTGNISADPKFVDAENGDYHLSPGSPCINSGCNDVLEIETDLEGNPRIRGGVVDMGAYEKSIEGFVISGRVRGKGMLSPRTTIVAPGGSSTFTATETHGSFRHFEIDGVVVSESPSYTWENILADGVITAVFDPKTWYVDASRPDDGGDGTSWETAKKTIQAAINSTAEGDIILVNDGIYAPILAADKAIAIRSVNGAQTTIIDGGKTERCAKLDGLYFEQNTVLNGFTLQNGYAAEGAGGGAYGGTLINCILVDNAALFQGGGAYNCTLTNCTLTGNSATEGGGVYNGYLLTNCILSGNTAEEGGGAYFSSLKNCTVTRNSATKGGGVIGCGLENSIVWGNFAPEGPNYFNPGYNNSWFDYSCTAPLPEEGAGNISADPKFVDAENGDYHLSSGSPCINSGSNGFVKVEADLEGNPRIRGNVVDMGAYEGSAAGFVISGQIQGEGMLSPMVALVVSGGSATFTATETHGPFRHFEIDGVVVSESPSYTWENIQADGVITAVFDSKTWHVDASMPNDDGNGSSWETAKKTIQAAIDGAKEGDNTILVKDGIYESIQTADKAITIRSVNGAQTTIIDGGKTERCATMGGPDSERKTVLDGFTLRNGYAAEGEGGGAYGGTLINCILVDNAVPAGDDGAPSHGGGAYKCTLTNCTLTGNQARFGGGVHSCFLTNCTLTRNEATGSGGGAYWCGLRSCTVTGNSATKGGGVMGCGLENCIAWDNFAPENPNYHDSWFDYSCTEPPIDGANNISADPMFVDAEKGDYHLRAGSPCINSGCNDFVEVETDLEGNPRIRDEVVDMGAYEGSVEGFVIFGQIQGEGMLSPMIAIVVPGGSATFTATETHGPFRHFEIDGVVVSELPNYTWENIQADGVITAVFDPITWYVDASILDEGGSGSSWETAKKTIQAAIDAAAEGDIILVNDGIYESIQTADKAITIRSVNGAQTTIIDGGKAERCATLGGPDSERKTVLDGFTLQNGYAAEGEGGGAYGGTLINCILVDNAVPLGEEGVPSHGGGAYKCTLTNCTLTGNQADLGGGAHSCTLTNCILTGNQADLGGGVYNGILLTNCILSGNTAEEGGGVYIGGLVNCTVTGNSATIAGGGVMDCGSMNSIVWNNSAPEDANHGDSWFEHSCTEPPIDGAGNISADPKFVNAENGDYSLSPGSPCINSGSNEIVQVETDLAGNLRIRDEVVDMGAFESAGTPVLPEFKYDWQSGWNTLYLPFDSLDPATAEALAKMPVFRLSANTNVLDTPVSLHTPLWIFCAAPKLAPVLRGALTQEEPPDPLDIPVGQWTQVGAQRQVETLPDGYAAWEWRTRRYVRVQSLQAGRVYFIYRLNTP